jgi:hypothetical protein
VLHARSRLISRTTERDASGTCELIFLVSNERSGSVLLHELKEEQPAGHAGVDGRKNMPAAEDKGRMNVTCLVLQPGGVIRLDWVFELPAS